MRITDPKIGWLVAQRKSWHSCELNPTWVIVGELGKSWPGVLSWDPQYLCKKRKRMRRAITSVCQYSALVWSWRNHSWWRKTGLCCKPAQIHTALACAGSTTAHKGHWHFSTWFYSRKGPAEIECCCCCEHQWKRMQLHCQVPLRHVFAIPGVRLLSPFHHWRCLPAPELHWGLILPTFAGSSWYAQWQHRLWAV